MKYGIIKEKLEVIFNMATVINNILDNQHLSLGDISKKSGVALSTLKNAAKKPIENWSIRVLNAFAEGLDTKPTKLLGELQPDGYSLKIDNKKQTIQDVYIPDKEQFQQIRFVVESEHLEGWNPTKKDIEYLLDEAINPDPKLDDEIDKVFGDQVDPR